MGYHVEIIRANAFIQADKVSAACDEMLRFMDTEANFKWMNHDKCMLLLENDDLHSFLEEWGFVAITDSNSNVRIVGYDSKAGDEELMLERLSPFIQEGTYLVWMGQDGEMYVHVFDEAGMKTLEAMLTW